MFYFGALSRFVVGWFPVAALGGLFFLGSFPSTLARLSQTKRPHPIRIPHISYASVFAYGSDACMFADVFVCLFVGRLRHPLLLNHSRALHSHSCSTIFVYPSCVLRTGLWYVYVCLGIFLCSAADCAIFGRAVNDDLGILRPPIQTRSSVKEQHVVSLWCWLSFLPYLLAA